MGKKYKIIIGPQVKKQMAKLSDKDQNMLLKAFEKLSKNPYAGHPWNPKEIKTFPNEKFCRFCGTPVKMMMDPKDNEVHIECGCDHSWMTKEELITGRKNNLKKANKSPKDTRFVGLNPNKVEFL